MPNLYLFHLSGISDHQILKKPKKHFSILHLAEWLSWSSWHIKSKRLQPNNSQAVLFFHISIFVKFFLSFSHFFQPIFNYKTNSFCLLFRWPLQNYKSLITITIDIHRWGVGDKTLSLVVHIHVFISGLWITNINVLKNKNSFFLRSTYIRYTPLLSYAKSAILHIRFSSTCFYSCYMNLWPQRPAPILS